MGQTSFEPRPGESDGYGFGYEPSVPTPQKSEDVISIFKWLRDFNR
jgi:hypothetical protein